MSTATSHGGATAFTDIHRDIIESHILTRLDGPTLASASCSSSDLHSLSSHHHLWSSICHVTFPSTASSSSLRRLISAFPGGPRAFFSLTYPLLLPTTSTTATSPPPELISAVDIFYKDTLVFSKVQETETVTGWFRCSPFRIDMLDPKDVVTTSTRHPEGDVACESLVDDMSLSWVLIDREGHRAANLSSHKPVFVQRHWLTGEVQVRFATILAGGKGTGGPATSEYVQCGIVVTCGASENGEMQVREVSLQMEDMDGTHLVGKDSLVILHRAMEGKRGNKEREEGGRRRYKEYLEMKRERIERKLRAEGTLDTLCVGIGATIFAAFSFWVVLVCT